MNLLIKIFNNKYLQILFGFVLSIFLLIILSFVNKMEISYNLDFMFYILIILLFVIVGCLLVFKFKIRISLIVPLIYAACITLSWYNYQTNSRTVKPITYYTVEPSTYYRVNADIGNVVVQISNQNIRYASTKLESHDSDITSRNSDVSSRNSEIDTNLDFSKYRYIINDSKEALTLVDSIKTIDLRQTNDFVKNGEDIANTLEKALELSLNARTTLELSEDEDGMYVKLADCYKLLSDIYYQLGDYVKSQEILEISINYREIAQKKEELKSRDEQGLSEDNSHMQNSQ